MLAFRFHGIRRGSSKSQPRPRLCQRASGTREVGDDSRKCSCCGASGFNIRGCGCRGGKSHTCLKAVAQRQAVRQQRRVQRRPTEHLKVPEIKDMTFHPDTMVTGKNDTFGKHRPDSTFKKNEFEGTYRKGEVSQQSGISNFSVGVREEDFGSQITTRGEAAAHIGGKGMEVGFVAGLSSDGGADVCLEARRESSSVRIGVDSDGNKILSVRSSCGGLPGIELSGNDISDLSAGIAPLDATATVRAKVRSESWHSEQHEFVETAVPEGRLYSSSKVVSQGTQTCVDVACAVHAPEQSAEIQIGTVRAKVEKGRVRKTTLKNAAVSSMSHKSTHEASLLVGDVKKSSKTSTSGDTTTCIQQKSQKRVETRRRRAESRREKQIGKKRSVATQTTEHLQKVQTDNYSASKVKSTDNFFETKTEVTTVIGSKVSTVEKKTVNGEVKSCKEQSSDTAKVHTKTESEGILHNSEEELTYTIKDGKKKLISRSKQVSPSEHVEASASSFTNTTAALGTKATMDLIKRGRTDITPEVIMKEGAGAAATSGASSVLSKGVQKMIKCPNATAGFVAAGASAVRNFEGLSSKSADEQSRAVANIVKDGASTYAISKAPALLGAKCAGSAGAAVQAAQSLLSAGEKISNGDTDGAAKEICTGSVKAAGTYVAMAAVGGPVGFVLGTVFSVFVDSVTED